MHVHRESEMSNIKDGGPAFPVQDAATWQAHGMTLRDYFAAKAMQGFAADPECGSLCSDSIADLAYIWADAMLNKREAK